MYRYIFYIFFGSIWNLSWLWYVMGDINAILLLTKWLSVVLIQLIYKPFISPIDSRCHRHLLNIHMYLSLVCGACILSHVQLSVTQWTVTSQSSLSMRFSRQESWGVVYFCLFLHSITLNCRDFITCGNIW